MLTILGFSDVSLSMSIFILGLCIVWIWTVVLTFRRCTLPSNWSLSYPCNRPWRYVGLWDVKYPTLSRQSAERWRWGCHSYAPAALYPLKIRDTHFCQRLSRPQGHSAAGRIRPLDKSTDFVWNRMRSLPACSSVSTNWCWRSLIGQPFPSVLAT
jgi:hypothetical protein